MEISTKAIVLHLTRVSDRASILHLYTRECGRVAYTIYGSEKKRKGQISPFIPLALLDIEAVHLENRDVQTLRDYSPAMVASHTASDICRQTEAIFIAEVLYRTLTHPLPDTALFDYLCHIIEQLDSRPDPENVHLEFLAGFLDQLGFGIDYEDTANRALRPLAAQPLNTSLSRSERQQLLRTLMDYYLKYVPDFQEPKSLDVMTEVFA